MPEVFGVSTKFMRFELLWIWFKKHQGIRQSSIGWRGNLGTVRKRWAAKAVSIWRGRGSVGAVGSTVCGAHGWINGVQCAWSASAHSTCVHGEFDHPGWASGQISFAGLHCIGGLPHLLIQLIFHVTSKLKLEIWTFLICKNNESWHGCRSVQMEQVSFLSWPPKNSLHFVL
jgi:hypothetical protein